MSRADLAERGVLVVGASLAGVSAISELRSQGFDGSIRLIGSEEHPPYSRPPLSKGILKGSERIEEIGLPPLDEDVEIHLGVTAVSLDPAERVVITGGGEEMPYGGLVISTGARARTIEPPGGRSERVLRTVDDYRDMSKSLEHAKTVLMIGGGFLGMEVASACHELGREVTIVDLQPPLRSQLGTFLSELIVASARKGGVEIHTSPNGISLRGDHDAVEAVELDDGTVITADLVLTAVGCVPNIEWLEDSGLEIDGGVHIDELCRVAPGIVAAGDVTRVAAGDRVAGRTPQWMNAFDQGRIAARSLIGPNEPDLVATVPYFWTEAFGIELRIAGALPVMGAPAAVEGTLVPGQPGPALLSWGPLDASRTCVAVNKRMPAARLRRLVAARRSG